MFYAIVGHDGPDTLPRRRAQRLAHVQRLRALVDAGRLLLAGSLPAIDSPDPGPAGFTGSLIVAEFASLEEARAWAAVDPYVASGIYSSVDVRPFVTSAP